MSKQKQYPSYAECVEAILMRSSHPVGMNQLIAQVEAMRPTGKSVRSAIYQALGKLYQAVPTAPGYFGWLSTLLQGQWFRHPLTQEEMRRGYLLLDELEHAVFFPEFFQDYAASNRSLQVELMGGPTLSCQGLVEKGTWSLSLGKEFSRWLDMQGASPQDDILIWVRDAAKAQYGLRLQPRESRQEAQIAERNHLLVMTAEEIVRGDRKARDTVPIWELAAGLIGRGLYDYPIPPDDMNYVLHEQSHLRLLDDMGYGLHQPTALQRSWSSILSRESNPPDSSWLEQEESLNDQFSVERWLDALAAYEESDDIFWDDDVEQGFGPLPTFTDGVDAEQCEGYQAYLAEFYASAYIEQEQPLNHSEFHLLEAELEMLIGLEQDFGFLLPEQENRKLELADRLFVDLSFFFDEGDWDQSDHDDPPYWMN
jgi:hypothetical protein